MNIAAGRTLCRRRTAGDDVGVALLLVLGMFVSPVLAETAAPIIGPKPVFVPGLYETESRNTAFKAEGVKSKTCIASADFDAFQRDTIAQYLKTPQFNSVCKLSETKPLTDGFAFAMDCVGAKTIIAFHFAKDFMSSTTQTKIVARPEYSSTILTLSRRIGDCKGRQTPRGEEL